MASWYPHLSALEEVSAPLGSSLPQDSPLTTGTSSSAVTVRATSARCRPGQGTNGESRPTSVTALDLFISRRDRSLFDRFIRWMFSRPDRRVW